MLKTRPTVTVCIATKDRAHSLPRAVETVLAQTYQAFELLIVDDGSADGTQQVIGAYESRDARIRGIHHAENRGLAAARNRAIFDGTGTYFTFVDDDDAWSPQFIERCVEVAEQGDGTRCYCTGYESPGALGDQRRHIPCFDGPLLDYIVAGYTPPVAAQFYVRDQLISIGGYNEFVRSGVDHDLWLRLAAEGAKLLSVPHVLALPDTSLTGKNRMTTDFQKRRARIAESLRLWRPLFADTFPRGFYTHFTRSYDYAIARKELAALVQSRKVAAAIRLMRASPFPARLAGFVLFRLIIRTLSLLSARESHAHPACIPPSFPPWQAS